MPGVALPTVLLPIIKELLHGARGAGQKVDRCAALAQGQGFSCVGSNLSQVLRKHRAPHQIRQHRHVPPIPDITVVHASSPAVEHFCKEVPREIQTLMAQGRSTKIILMIKWIRTRRLSMKNSLSLPRVGFRADTLARASAGRGLAS